MYKSMTFEEFFQNDYKFDTFKSKILKNESFKKFTIVFLGCMLYSQKVLAAGKGIDALGFTLLSLIRQWAYWVILIMCLVDVIRAGVSGDSKKILSILMRYVIIFASMYLVPSIFDSIKASF